MSDKTTCPLCQKELTYAGLTKHIFSGGHKKDILDHLVKQKVLALRYMKDYKATKHLPFITINHRVRIHLCYGCNKCYKTNSPQDKKHICPKVDEGFNIIKKMLEEPTTTPTEEPQATPLPSSPNPADEKEIAKLNKKILALERNIEINEQIVAEAELKSEKADMFLTGLNYCIRYIKGEQREVYQAFLPNFQEVHPELLEFVKL